MFKKKKIISLYHYITHITSIYHIYQYIIYHSIVAISIVSLIWVWVNTYRYIFSGMNIHFNPAMTWGSRHGTRVLTHPHITYHSYHINISHISIYHISIVASLYSFPIISHISIVARCSPTSTGWPLKHNATVVPEARDHAVLLRGAWKFHQQRPGEIHRGGASTGLKTTQRRCATLLVVVVGDDDDLRVNLWLIMVNNG